MALVTVHMASESVVYLHRLIDLGAVTGVPSNVAINPTIRPVLDALYEVLAGGQVTVTTVKPGDRTVVDDLKKKEQQSISATNQINSAVGFAHALPA
jgi:hypothetical protein